MKMTIEQARAKEAELIAKLEKNQKRKKKIDLEIAQMSKRLRAERTRRLIQVGAIVSKLVPELNREDLTPEQAKEILTKLLPTDKTSSPQLNQ